MVKFRLSLDKKTAGILALAVFFFFVDRYFKFLALAGFKFQIVGSFFQFDLAKNFGVAFSLPLTGVALNWLILTIVVLMAGVAGFQLKRANMSYFSAISVVILGSLSNLFDRFGYGYVIDYFDLNYFTVFNIADVLICVGLVWVFWLELDNNGKVW